MNSNTVSVLVERFPAGVMASTVRPSESASVVSKKSPYHKPTLTHETTYVPQSGASPTRYSPNAESQESNPA
jgi:hypothetical protein